MGLVLWVESCLILQNRKTDSKNRLTLTLFGWNQGSKGVVSSRWLMNQISTLTLMKSSLMSSRQTSNWMKRKPLFCRVKLRRLMWACSPYKSPKIQMDRCNAQLCSRYNALRTEKTFGTRSSKPWSSRWEIWKGCKMILPQLLPRRIWLML